MLSASFPFRSAFRRRSVWCTHFSRFHFSNFFRLCLIWGLTFYLQAFVPVFECKDKRWAFNNGQYYLPAMPIIWKDERTILCFAVRTFSKSGVSYNDAYMIDTSSQAAMPYLAADGNQLSISNLVFGAGSVLMEEDELIVAAYHEPSCYWIGFEGTPLADAVFTLSLSTGQADLLTVDSEALSYNTDSIVVHGGSR